jgi:hypothetical protein
MTKQVLGSAGWEMLLGEFADAEGMQATRKRFAQPLYIVGHITKVYKPGYIDGPSANAAFRSPTFLHSIKARLDGVDEAVLIADTGTIQD